ncbi:MAG TPA: hypothetical protein VL691_12205 [Vicinamibacteria bacterium]|nr:hypothetical protein [Vicinamibacteria bacterium]
MGERLEPALLSNLEVSGPEARHGSALLVGHHDIHAHHPGHDAECGGRLSPGGGKLLGARRADEAEDQR